MSYATVEQFIEMFGEDEAIALSNLDDPETVIVRPEPIERALGDASALMDGYLRSAGYTLPLSTEIAVLQRCASDLARYYLDRIRAREDVKARYDSWLKWLADVAKGNVELATGDTDTDAILSNGGAESWYETRIFDFGTLRDY